MPEQVGQKNIYLCSTCGGQIVTVIVDEGTTPMMLACRARGEPDSKPINSGRERFLARREGRSPIVSVGCPGVMRSTFYQFVPAGAVPTHEWFRPANVHNYPPEAQEHFKLGGLEIRLVDAR